MSDERQVAKVADREIVGRALFEQMKVSVVAMDDLEWDTLVLGSSADPRTRNHWLYEARVAVEALWRAGRLDVRTDQEDIMDDPDNIGPGSPHGDGHHYIDRINSLIVDLARERSLAKDNSAGRNLSLAITHLEDALLRVSPPLTYRPNPGNAHRG